ncbi:MAG: hypothetical protein WCP97_00460 [bacterium]
MTINKNIKVIKVEDFPSANIQTATFELNSLQYYAVRKYNDDGITTECKYGRELKNEYYDTVYTLKGEDASPAMNNKSVECWFGELPEDVFSAIRGLAR